MHYTPDSDTLRRLHDAVLDIVAVINRPDRDERLIREAGIRLDRALFPLLVLTERFGPIGVVDLAGRVGRDHSTVSRQAAKLVQLGLVERRERATDRRLRELHATLGRAQYDPADRRCAGAARPARLGWLVRASGRRLRRLAPTLRRCTRLALNAASLRTGGLTAIKHQSEKADLVW